MIKATRKLVRTLIEQSGFDGKEVKANRLLKNYSKGIVKWKDSDGKWQRVGEWDQGEQSMKLSGYALQFHEAFNTLMKGS
eukprot:10422047-Karenia_brevis.AAC.1